MTERPDDHIQVPANIAVIVEALGPDLAVDFLLEFGGGELSLGARPLPNNPVRRTLGDEAAERLGRVAHRLPHQIPLARRWLVQQLRSRGLSQSQIARTLRVGRSTVKRHLRGEHDPNQLSLFED